MNITVIAGLAGFALGAVVVLALDDEAPNILIVAGIAGLGFVAYKKYA